MASSFTDFMREMADEARQSGPAAEAACVETQQRHWIARLLFDRRRELGFTQAKLAATSGIDQADISKIEHAEANPTLETLSALATALRCTLALQPIPEETLALSAGRQALADRRCVPTAPDRAVSTPARVTTRAVAAASGRAVRAPRAASASPAAASTRKARPRATS